MRTYGNQYIVESLNNKSLMKLFHSKCEKGGIVHDNKQILEYMHTFEEKGTVKQLSLWDL